MCRSSKRCVCRSSASWADFSFLRRWGGRRSIIRRPTVSGGQYVAKKSLARSEILDCPSCPSRRLRSTWVRVRRLFGVRSGGVAAATGVWRRATEIGRDPPLFGASSADSSTKREIKMTARLALPGIADGGGKSLLITTAALLIAEIFPRHWLFFFASPAARVPKDRRQSPFLRAPARYLANMTTDQLLIVYLGGCEMGDTTGCLACRPRGLFLILSRLWLSLAPLAVHTIRLYCKRVRD